MNEESVSKSGEIYDSLVSEYAAIKTNVFKVKYEEPKFWEALGDVTGKDVLDLACGSGHFTRGIKEKGAKNILGVDISEQMILEARKIESDKPLGIDYCVSDASSDIFKSDSLFDVVTAQYLLCYAESLEKLKQFCASAFNNLKPEGGRFLTLTDVLEGVKNHQISPSDISYEPLSPENEEGTPWFEGCRGRVTILSGDKKSKCSFPIYFWEFDTVKSALIEVGFESVEKYQFENEGRKPTMIISALKSGK